MENPESREFLITHTIWDASQITPRSLTAILQLEASHPVIPYWERQTERLADGRFTALGAIFDTISNAENSVKEKRQILIKWMCEVCTASECESSVLPHAIKMIDRFLVCTKCKAKHLQAVGAACILISSKFRETTPLGISKISQMTRGAVSEDMLRDVEVVILMKLHWDIGCVTYSEFLPFLFDILASNPDCAHIPQLHEETFRKYVSKYVDKIAALCYWAEPDLISQRPSVLAVCALGVFFQRMNYLEPGVMIRALHGYITTIRSHQEMQTCWDCATNVWRTFARPSTAVTNRTVRSGSTATTDGTDAPTDGTRARPSLAPPSFGPSPYKMGTSTIHADNDEDNDSGNYSSMERP